MHMFYNELHVYFTTISYAFSLRILCMYMARNYNYPTAVFFPFAYSFLQDLIKMLIMIRCSSK